MLNSSSYESTFSVFKSKKAQFMVITAFVIVSIFYLVSKWMEPYTIPDTSEIVLMDEPFIMDNVKEEALAVVDESKSCEELEDNLSEFKSYIEDYAFKKLIIYFDYTIKTPCYAYDPEFPILVVFDIHLESQGTKYNSEFYGFWPEESAPA